MAKKKKKNKLEDMLANMVITVIALSILAVTTWVVSGVNSIGALSARVDSTQEILKYIRDDVTVIKNHLIGSE